MNRTWLLLLAIASPAMADDWKPAKGPLATRWAKDVDPKNPLPEYPRPQMVREKWTNLNGVWELAIAKADEAPPVGKTLPEKILVPFPVESALSGVMKPADRLWYRRMFEAARPEKGGRVLIHFGAVDYAAKVWVNGTLVGSHAGGYTPFSVDVTNALKGSGAEELIVGVEDPTDRGTQPRGKQVRRPGGIFYTSITGIWQTVWLETVPEIHFQKLKIATDVQTGEVSVIPTFGGDPQGLILEVTAFDGDREVAHYSGQALTQRYVPLKIASPKLWSPESPFLYNLKVEFKAGNRVVDSVSSYFGIRKIEVGPDEKGVTRILLNGKFTFQVGPLDQGFWPDGLYTAPTDEALKFDIEVTKKFGFNMTRKHVKVEPDRWYYWCDKLGLIVWQDMVTGDKSIGPNDPDIVRTPESAKQYEDGLKGMIDALCNHPSIVTWVVFNEGWGQFDTARIAQWTKKYDPTRLVDATSGWADRSVGDMHDWHVYPGPGSPKPEAKRAAVLGEFGGLGLGIDGHNWTDKTWGYRGTSDKADLTRKYENLLRRTWALKDNPGLSAAVYTQLTDVETEANGLLTYDREVTKVDLERVSLANRGKLPPPPEMVEIAATSRIQAVDWHYSTEKPADRWFEADFDDSSWKVGPGGFGTKGTPRGVIRTEWNTKDIWVRRSFDLPAVNLLATILTAHHDEDAEVYLNGILAAKLTGYTTDYEDATIAPEALLTLKPGKNTLAIHCHQTGGGQYIDAGLVEAVEVGKKRPENAPPTSPNR